MDVIRRPQHGDLDISAVTAAASEGRLTVSLDEPRNVLAKIDNYPFDGQTEYQGSLSYTEVHPAPGQSGMEEEFQFVYRSESGLLFLYEVESGYEMPLFEVLKRLNTSLTDDRFAAPSFPREALWSFAFEAIERPSMTVHDLEGHEFNFAEERDLSPTELVSNYILDQATLNFEYERETIEVEYSEGSISFPGEEVSWEGRDYILQLVERFLIAGEMSDNVREMIRN